MKRIELHEKLMLLDKNANLVFQICKRIQYMVCGASRKSDFKSECRQNKLRSLEYLGDFLGVILQHSVKSTMKQ